MMVKACPASSVEACMFGVAKKCPIMNSWHGADGKALPSQNHSASSWDERIEF